MSMQAEAQQIFQTILKQFDPDAVRVPIAPEALPCHVATMVDQVVRWNRSHVRVRERVRQYPDYTCRVATLLTVLWASYSAPATTRGMLRDLAGLIVSADFEARQTSCTRYAVDNLDGSPYCRVAVSLWLLVLSLYSSGRTNHDLPSTPYQAYYLLALCKECNLDKLVEHGLPAVRDLLVARYRGVQMLHAMDESLSKVH